jgi:hypothetical protein
MNISIKKSMFHVKHFKNDMYTSFISRVRIVYHRIGTKPILSQSDALGHGLITKSTKKQEI